MRPIETERLDRITASLETVSCLLEVMRDRLDEEVPPGAAQYLALIEGTISVLGHDVKKPIAQMITHEPRVPRMEFRDDAPSFQTPFVEEE